MERTRSISLLIADDHPLAREGLRALLSTMHDMDVAGEAQDGLDAVRLVAELHPDVVLMDARMQGAGGIEATRSIKARWPETKVIVLTLYPSYRHGAVGAGADAFLLKGHPSQELLDVIRALGTRASLDYSAMRTPPAAPSGGPTG